MNKNVYFAYTFLLWLSHKPQATSHKPLASSSAISFYLIVYLIQTTFFLNFAILKKNRCRILSINTITEVRRICYCMCLFLQLFFVVSLAYASAYALIRTIFLFKLSCARTKHGQLFCFLTKKFSSLQSFQSVCPGFNCIIFSSIYTKYWIRQISSSSQCVWIFTMCHNF